MLSCACSGIVYRWRQNVITDVLDPLTPKIRLLTHLTFFFNDANTKQQQKKLLLVLTLSLRVSSKNDMTKNQSKVV